VPCPAAVYKIAAAPQEDYLLGSVLLFKPEFDNAGKGDAS